MTFTGTVKDGKLFIDKIEQFRRHLLNYPTGKRVKITVENITHPRSDQQNKYYWGCVVKEIAEHTDTTGSRFLNC